MTGLIVWLFVLAVAGTLFLRPNPRSRALFLGALLALLLSLTLQSTPRQVGDAGEYVVMARKLGHLARPSLTAEDLAVARQLFPGDPGERLDMPQLRGPDGRQDLPHFWLYPLLAAPFVRIAEATGANLITGFTVLNLLLLMALAALLLRRVSVAVAALIVAGPIVWWLDKAHAEVLTYVLLAFALVEMAHAPWWSIVALGFASAQNPPIAAAMLTTIGIALQRTGWRDRRIWSATALGVLLAALHPLYYYSRLRVWTGLYEGIDRHWPTWREFLTVPFDPNLGIFVHDPLLLVATIIAAIEVITRPRTPKASPEAAEATVFPRLGRNGGIGLGLIAMLFLLSFTQTTNVNSGGTPDPSRYGLWLVPFALPILAAVPGQPSWLTAIAAASVAWCAWAFAPALPDQNLRPTSFAAALWSRWPGVDNPLAEVFAERTAGRELARPPVATAGCEKVLLWGDGSGAAWPSACTPVTIPANCQAKNALCYANRVDGTYRFVEAQSPPAWRIEISRSGVPRWSGGMLAITQETPQKIPMAIWQEDGWSYAERLTVPEPDITAREWRWIGDRAGVSVMTSERVSARMKIVARALNKPRRLRVALGTTEIATLLIDPRREEYQTGEFTVPAGTSIISLESLDGSESPGANDPRRLSVAIFRIELLTIQP
jgi:hypothetical protein